MTTNLIKNVIYHQHQSGHQKHHSTLTIVLNFKKQYQKAFKNGEVTKFNICRLL